MTAHVIEALRLGVKGNSMFFSTCNPSPSGGVGVG
jgi:hypothetical protein